MIHPFVLACLESLEPESSSGFQIQNLMTVIRRPSQGL
jgi:hypothetical protein